TNIQNGLNAVLTETDIQSNLEKNIGKLRGWAKSAGTAGVSARDFERAMSGDQAAALKLIPQLQGIADKHKTVHDTGHGVVTSFDDAGNAAHDLARHLQHVNVN